MSDVAKELWFVQWPDGKVVHTSPAFSRAGACENAVRYWLPREWFQGLELTSLYYGPLADLWKAMERSGFKLVSVPVPANTTQTQGEAE